MSENHAFIEKKLQRIHLMAAVEAIGNYYIHKLKLLIHIRLSGVVRLVVSLKLLVAW